MQKNITVSVDDGHPLDLKVAEMLAEKGIKATFYIPIKNREGRPTLKSSQIKRLSKEFDIGAHTYNHLDLTTVSEVVAKQEIVNGKKALQEIIGKEVSSFCPPRGKFNLRIIKIVKEAGFKNLRSSRIFNFARQNKKDFIINPNLHIYPHKMITVLKHCLKYTDLISITMRLKYARLNQFDFIEILKTNKQPFHIWFHSYEIEELKLWDLIRNL